MTPVEAHVRQAELLESAPQLRQQAIAAEKARLEAAERSLGLTSADDAGASTSDSTEAGPSNKLKRIAEVDVAELARKRHRFEDNKFFEESREIKDNVRSAVAAGEFGSAHAGGPNDRPVEEEEEAQGGW